MSLPSSNLELTLTRPPSIKLKILRTFNFLSILLASFSNSYFIVFSGSNGHVNHKFPTYFTPSSTFVGIFWLGLHLLQLGFAFIAQFSNLRIVQDVVENAVGWWFTLSNLFLCGQLFFLMREHFFLSGLFALLGLISTSIAHNRLTVNYPQNHLPTSVAPKVVSFIHTPFAMFSAFSWFSLFYNGFLAFAQGDKKGYAIAAVVSACFMAIIGVAWSITGFFSKGKRDGVFGAIIAWALLGVAVHQRRTKFLSITCLVLAFTQLLAILIVWYMYGGKFTESPRISSRPTRKRVSTSRGVDIREPLLQSQQNDSLSEP